ARRVGTGLARLPDSGRTWVRPESAGRGRAPLFPPEPSRAAEAEGARITALSVRAVATPRARLEGLNTEGSCSFAQRSPIRPREVCTLCRASTPQQLCQQ